MRAGQPRHTRLVRALPECGRPVKARPPALEKQIKSTGFFRQKAKALIGMAKALVAEHGGEVPADMALLTMLPGVGRKTANVVLGHALECQGLPVDRHVLEWRTESASPRRRPGSGGVAAWVDAPPAEMWTLASDVQILHGRRIRRPKPLCDRCSIAADCDYFLHVARRTREDR